MTYPMTHRSDAEVARTADVPVRDAGRGSPTRGLVSMAAGGFGVVAATLPSMGIIALVLAAVALGVGVPVMRRGPGTASFSFARSGVVLGMIAVLIGVLSVALQLLA